MKKIELTSNVIVVEVLNARIQIDGVKYDVDADIKGYSYSIRESFSGIDVFDTLDEDEIEEINSLIREKAKVF